MAQKQRVLQYIQDHGSISSLEAFKDLGITRLSAVIFNLRRDGIGIESDTEEAINRFGEKARFSRYRLAE